MDKLEDLQISSMRLKLRKGIYLLPSLITTLNFACGFYALIAVFNGLYYNAAVAIMLAALFDFLDGKVARATNTTSHFGMEYDSLTDLMSFGIAPAFLVYAWVLQPYGRVGWMAAFLYVICGALRLARFNTAPRTAIVSTRFIGLPIPGAAMTIASLVILTKEFLAFERVHPVVLVAMVYFLAFLMVSNIRYASPKKLELSRRRPFGILVFMVLTLYVVAVIPELMIFVVTAGYVLSGPVEWLLFRKSRTEKGTAHESSRV